MTQHYRKPFSLFDWLILCHLATTNQEQPSRQCTDSCRVICFSEKMAKASKEQLQRHNVGHNLEQFKPVLIYFKFFSSILIGHLYVCCALTFTGPHNLSIIWNWNLIYKYIRLWTCAQLGTLLYLVLTISILIGQELPPYFQNSRDFVDKHDYSIICYPIMSSDYPVCSAQCAPLAKERESWVDKWQLCTAQTTRTMAWFSSSSETNIAKLLEDKDAENTKRST